MNVRVDFLPAAYRERRFQRQRRVQRMLLTIPVLIGLCVTDLVLCRRVDIAAAMAANAEAHADQAEQRVMQLRQLAARLVQQQEALEGDLLPLRAPRMVAMLDAIVSSRPPGVDLIDFQCSHKPWATLPASSVRVTASCSTTEVFEAFLAALRTEVMLPPLQCTRTFRAENGLGFHLETTAEPASPR